jgi:RNA polymerase sigma-70 factor, ECF subfamily
MEERDVTVLLERVLDGEPEGFSPLVAEYTPGLFNLASKMAGGPEEAPDIVQETFFRAYRDLGRFDGRTRFYSWLCGICVNVCHDARKRRQRAWRRERPMADGRGDEMEASAPTAAEDLLRAQDEGRLRRCLGLLPETLRAALLLRFQEDLSIQEVAQQLRIGLSAAKMRIQRGLSQMRDCMAPPAERGAA